MIIDWTVYDTVEADTLEIGDNVILYDEESGYDVPATITDIQDTGAYYLIDADTDAALEPFRNYVLFYDDEVDLWTL